MFLPPQKVQEMDELICPIFVEEQCLTCVQQSGQIAEEGFYNSYTELVEYEAKGGKGIEP